MSIGMVGAAGKTYLILLESRLGLRRGREYSRLLHPLGESPRPWRKISAPRYDLELALMAETQLLQLSLPAKSMAKMMIQRMELEDVDQ